MRRARQNTEIQPDIIQICKHILRLQDKNPKSVKQHKSFVCSKLKLDNKKKSNAHPKI